jgi:glyoxalase superfamily protein
VTLRWQCICIDSTDPASLATWWAELLGWRITSEEDDEVALEPPEGSPADGVSPDILFLRVPEAKTVKDRIHIDLRPDNHAAEVARAEAMGARRVDVGQGTDKTWVVLADPEGNEFCILRTLRADEVTDAPSQLPPAIG